MVTVVVVTAVFATLVVVVVGGFRGGLCPVLGRRTTGLGERMTVFWVRRPPTPFCCCTALPCLASRATTVGTCFRGGV